APIVNPDRRAIGSEQALGAVAEDVEARCEVQRRRQAARELVDELAKIALQLVALTVAEQLERGDKHVADFRPVVTRGRGSRGIWKANREHPDALVALHERDDQHRTAA